MAGLIFTTAFFSTHAQSISPPENPTYSRSDCMVRIDFKEPADKGEEYPPLGEFTDFIFKYTVENLMPFGFGGGRPGNGIFLTYWVRCDEKYEFTEALIAEFVEEHPGYFEMVSVSRDKIEPDIGRHVQCGPWWSDGYVGCR